ncbi:ATP-binding protein [Methylobacterium nodulans]|uniref:histidine kinase n=1 Tax=Methylobacterium nodulans (strain LMG 21967 / CNCM I-2342 / ORS 2060) TaxID=460265 RepID=B8IKX8_METNO|nr:ATP-binding protein [Methylobacterium nodulans]ACL58166.1 Hpt sensor hybrid histidine kinase [Methylobacterium nodulans ORS 2060]
MERLNAIMFSQSGIGRRLFVAFLIIASLSLTPGLFAWLILRDVAETQTLLSARALPAVVTAQSMVESSDQLVAMGPALRRVNDPVEFERQKTDFARLRDQIRRLLTREGEPVTGSSHTSRLKYEIESLLSDLERQEALVAERLPLAARFENVVGQTMDAARNLTELSETFVSNAHALSLALIADLYKPKDPKLEDEAKLEMLDQIVERNIYNLQQMSELRLAASQIGVVVNKFRYASKAIEVSDIRTEYLAYIETITRRVTGIADPTRRQQAKSYLEALRNAISDNAPDGGLAGARSRIVAIGAQSDNLARTAERSADATRTIAADLLKAAQASSAAAASRGESAVTWGFIILIMSTVAAVGASGFVVWLLVERRLVRPLEEVTLALERLSDGDVDVDVDIRGAPELQQLGRAVVVFRDESKRRRMLEVEQAETNLELLRHRRDLQQLVREQTAMLEAANELLRIEAVEHAAARTRAEAASRAKTEFLAVMSHEIRTPLTGMIGMMDLLSSAELKPEQARWLDGARRSSAALLRVLDSILSYGRAETSEIALDIEPVDVRTLVEGVGALMQPVAEAKGLCLELEVDPDLWPLHRADDGKIQQIIVNLVSNAIKFSERGVVRVEVVALDEDQDFQSVRFDVNDMGVGVPSDQLERIFEPFAQADNSITRRYGGTGLGLAISRRLAALMGGEVSAVSEPGRGSTFSLTLRLERAERYHYDAARRERGIEPVQSRQVLLIEDDEATRIVASTYLERLGHEVIAACDGASAVEALEQFRPDIIVTDVSLPDFDGPEVVARLRERLGDPHLPAVCMSAHVFPDDVERFVSLGMNAFVAKPLSPIALSGAMASALNSSSLAHHHEAFAADLAALGPAVMASLIEAARNTMPARLDALDRALAEGDGDNLRRLAHAIQSTAGSLNMSRLLESAQRVERSGAGPGDGELSRLVAECRLAWDAGLKAIESQVQAAQSAPRTQATAAPDR